MAPVPVGSTEESGRWSARFLGFLALGGALGATLRVLLGEAVFRLAPMVFPLATLGVNALGSFLLGFLDRRLPPDPGSPLRAFAVPGFCGGFTTFSAFGVEGLMLLEDGRPGVALAYMAVSIAVCLLGVLLGRRV